MKGNLQACLGFVLVCLPVTAQDYRSPEVIVSKFGKELQLLDREREKLAKNLVIYAGNRVVKKNRKGHSLAIARRFIALSLHLAPKNSAATVLDRRLSAGEMPLLARGEYGNDTFSDVLLARSKDLRQGSKKDVLLSACLVEIAVIVNPKNKAAMRAMELQKIQRGSVDWNQLTGG